MASTHRPSSVCKARFRSFHIVCRCVFASLDSRMFWLLSLSTLIAALWFCLLCPTIENEFCLYVHLLTFWCNGWKFRNSLPISKSLRCGSAQVATTTQMQGRFWGVEKCSKTLPRTKGLHSSFRPRFREDLASLPFKFRAVHRPAFWVEIVEIFCQVLEGPPES